MATLTVTTLAANSSTLTSITFAASSSSGDSFVNTGKEVVMFTNSSSQGGATVTVTATGQNQDNFGGAGSLHTISIAVPTSSQFGVTAFGPFRPAIFNDANGKVQLTYSATGIAVAVVATPPQN